MTSSKTYYNKNILRRIRHVSIDNKKSAENTEDFFNDDFEVVYQEEYYSNFLRKELEAKPSDSYKTDNGYDDSFDDSDDNRYDDGYDDNYGGNYNDSRDNQYRGRNEHHYDYDDYDNYDDYDDYGYSRRTSYKKRLLAPDLISPASKTAKTGFKIIYRLINLLLRSATLILIGVITYTLAVNFWENHGAYGDILRAVAENNYILGAYAAVAAFLILFECIAFLLVLGTSKKSDRRGRRVDSGRGLFSFVFIYGAAYMAYFLNGLVPLTPAPLLGVQGALRVFGSMRFTLLPLCVAGIISCLVRKFAIR